jgi:hypothetical protein
MFPSSMDNEWADVWRSKKDVSRWYLRARTLAITIQPYDREGTISLDPSFALETLSSGRAAIFLASNNC